MIQNYNLPPNLYLHIVLWEEFYRANKWEELTFTWSYE